MYIWDEGWKEFKLGSVYGVAPETRIDQRTGDVGEFGHAVQPSYVAYLGGPEAFGWQLWTEAQRRGWQQATDTQVLGDGAAWIRAVALEKATTVIICSIKSCASKVGRLVAGW